MWWKNCYVGRPEAMFCELHFCFIFTLNMFFVLLFVKLKKKERYIFAAFLLLLLFVNILSTGKCRSNQKYL